MNKIFLVILFSLSLSACGGGGGGGTAAANTITQPPANNNTQLNTNFISGVFEASSEFKDACETPRSGNSFNDYLGSELTEKQWLRSWSNETYLWYDEITDVNPNLNYDKFQYFDLLKTNAITPSGNPRDKFHFTYSTEEWEQLSQSGVSLGYGVKWIFGSSTPPRDLHVAYVEPGSSAENAGLVRGMRVMEVDGVDFVNGATTEIIDTLNAGIFPSNGAEIHTFGMLAQGAADTGTYPKFNLTSGNVTSSPVLVNDIINTPTGDVGYLVFNDHIATAELALSNAIVGFSASSVTDLILDLRYNGGGLLAIASQLAYMIAGDANTVGRIFEETQFNDKSSGANTTFPFIDETLSFSAASGQNLPSLDLNRVYIITGSGTCSASESIINALNGIGVEIILVGDTTCGKPYGFQPQDNCGTTYFTIQFKGANDIGFGDYTDGFTPSNSGEGGVSIQGCAVIDDISKELGDVTESRLAAALAYRQIPTTCPAPPPASSLSSIKITPSELISTAIEQQNNFFQNNRILGRP